MLSVRNGGGGGSTVGASGNGGFETRDDLRYVVFVELRHGDIELIALNAIDQERRYTIASLEVLWTHLPNLALPTRLLPLHMEGTECVVGVFELMFLLRDLGSGMPDLALRVGKTLPGESNNFREGAVVGLDTSGDMLVLDEGGPEENEGIGGSRDMILRLLLRMSGLTTRILSI